MNKHFVNGKFNFSSDIEMVKKRIAANKYMSDARWEFVDSLGTRITALAEEVQDMKVRVNNKTMTKRRYLKKLIIINKTIEYYNSIIRRIAVNGQK